VWGCSSTTASWRLRFGVGDLVWPHCKGGCSRLKPFLDFTGKFNRNKSHNMMRSCWILVTRACNQFQSLSDLSLLRLSWHNTTRKSSCCFSWRLIRTWIQKLQWKKVMLGLATCLKWTNSACLALELQRKRLQRGFCWRSCLCFVDLWLIPLIWSEGYWSGGEWMRLSFHAWVSLLANILGFLVPKSRHRGFFQWLASWQTFDVADWAWRIWIIL
jgi:hypothetical protein